MESHICQNRADMGHPSFVTGKEKQVCEKSRLEHSSADPAKPYRKSWPVRAPTIVGNLRDALPLVVS